MWRIATLASGRNPASWKTCGNPIGVVAVIHGCRETIFRRQAIVRDQRARAQESTQSRCQRRMGVREAKRERSTMQIQDDALGAARRQRDPFGQQPVEVDRRARHVRFDRKEASVELFVFLTHRRDIGFPLDPSAHGELKQRVQRVQPASWVVFERCGYMSYGFAFLSWSRESQLQRNTGNPPIRTVHTRADSATRLGFVTSPCAGARRSPAAIPR